MSLEQHEVETIDNMEADFGQFLGERDFTNCYALKDQAGELGYESLALSMHYRINAAIKPFDVMGMGMDVITKGLSV